MAELLRKHGISEATFYNWRAKYVGMTVSEAKRLKELELENARLTRVRYGYMRIHVGLRREGGISNHTRV